MQIFCLSCNRPPIINFKYDLCWPEFTLETNKEHSFHKYIYFLFLKSTTYQTCLRGVQRCVRTLKRDAAPLVSPRREKLVIIDLLLGLSVCEMSPLQLRLEAADVKPRSAARSDRHVEDHVKCDCLTSPSLPAAPMTNSAGSSAKRSWRLQLTSAWWQRDMQIRRRHLVLAPVLWVNVLSPAATRGRGQELIIRRTSMTEVNLVQDHKFSTFKKT